MHGRAQAELISFTAPPIDGLGRRIPPLGAHTAPPDALGGAEASTARARRKAAPAAPPARLRGDRRDIGLLRDAQECALDEP